MEDDEYLYRLCFADKWDEASDYLDGLSRAEAVRQTQCTLSEGWTCASCAAQKDAPLQLTARLLKLGGEQVLRVTVIPPPPSTLSGITILHTAAANSNDPAVFRLLISSAPDLLVAAESKGYTPLVLLELCNVGHSNHAELLSLTLNCVAAYERKDFFSLIRHCGMSRPLAVALAPHVTVWLPLLRHRDDPSIVVSADTTVALAPVRSRAGHRSRDHAVHRPERGWLRGELDGERADCAETAGRSKQSNLS